LYVFCFCFFFVFVFLTFLYLLFSEIVISVKLLLLCLHSILSQCDVFTNVCQLGVSCEFTERLLYGDRRLPTRLAYHELIHQQVSMFWFIYVYLNAAVGISV